MGKKNIRKKTKLVLYYIIIIIFAAFFLFPIYWLLLQSFKVPLDTIANPPKFIFSPTLRNYLEVLEDKLKNDPSSLKEEFQKAQMLRKRL